MVDINREMTWEEVKQEYGGKTLYLNVLEEDENEDPICVYVYGIMTCVEDKALIRRRVQNGESGLRLRIPKDSEIFGKSDIFEARIL